jgi:acetyl-CoA acetyltransferase
MPWDSIDRKRDEDGFTFWTRDASRAIASGEYTAAIAILIEAGTTQEAAERFVAASLAVNMPFPLNGIPAHRDLAELVDVARNVMETSDWSFEQVATALERAQAGRR